MSREIRGLDKPASRWNDLRTLLHLTLTPIRGASHAERLENFYGKQAEGYDAFRKRLLPGRELLCQRVEIPRDGIWVDMGAGTGANVELAGERAARARRIYLVDLSPSLLRIAQSRAREHRWTNVSTELRDATQFVPAEGCADLITFSYSLTMIPDWFAAVDHAYDTLRRGGTIAVADFFVSRKYPPADLPAHSWFTRNFWPLWFSSDNVHLSCDHLPYLRRRFQAVSLECWRAPVPYMAGLQVPHYVFVGRKL